MKYDWKNLLESIEQQVTSSYSNEEISILYPEKPEKILLPPASPEDIHQLESRLQIALPTSYKEFLLTSNGLKILSTTYWNIFPSDQVTFLRDFDPHLVSIWENGNDDISDDEYFVYGEEQDSVTLRGKYMKNCVAVSGWGDAGILLLNPEIKFDDEWEAWSFANWYPGAYRYKSFWDLVKHKSSM